jgi:hypothetical protein
MRIVIDRKRTYPEIAPTLLQNKIFLHREFQGRNPTEVSAIVGNQGEIMMQRGGRNEYVKITDNLSCLPQLATDVRKAFHHRSVQWQNRDPL